MKSSAVIQSPGAVLIVRLSAIGDVVHAMPCLTALRRALPESRIGWVVGDAAAELLRPRKDLDRLYVVSRERGRPLRSASSFIRSARRIARDGYQCSFDLQGLTKSSLLPYVAGVSKRIGFDGENGRELSRFFNNALIAPPREARHVLEKNLSLLEAAGLKGPGGPAFGMEPPPEAESFARAWLEGEGLEPGGYLALNPGAGWDSKRWPVRHFRRLALSLKDKFGLEEIVLWGTERERSWAAEIGRPAPRTTLWQMAAFAALARAFVGGDTGPTHMAAALGVRTLGLFGASDPERNSPYGPRVKVVTAGTECSPCWKTRCPRGQVECMEKLLPETVLDELEEFL